MLRGGVLAAWVSAFLIGAGRASCGLTASAARRDRMPVRATGRTHGLPQNKLRSVHVVPRMARELANRGGLGVAGQFFVAMVCD